MISIKSVNNISIAAASSSIPVGSLRVSPSTAATATAAVSSAHPTTTPHPTTPHPTKHTTHHPRKSGRRFDTGSFIGGMFVTLALFIIFFVARRYWKGRPDYSKFT